MMVNYKCWKNISKPVGLGMMKKGIIFVKVKRPIKAGHIVTIKDVDLDY